MLALIITVVSIACSNQANKNIVREWEVYVPKFDTTFVEIDTVNCSKIQVTTYINDNELKCLVDSLYTSGQGLPENFMYRNFSLRKSNEVIIEIDNQEYPVFEVWITNNSSTDKRILYNPDYGILIEKIPHVHSKTLISYNAEGEVLDSIRINKIVRAINEDSLFLPQPPPGVSM